MASSLSLTDTVVAIIQKLFPPELADKSWDNTGLLLGEAPPSSGSPIPEAGAHNSILLTNDLTAQVVDEAVEKRVRVIICYHPVIFRPLKSITTQDPMQKQLLRLAAERISIYCPHTAMDAAIGGLNDWLCDILTQSLDQQEKVLRKAIEPVSGLVPKGHEGAGYGRIMSLPRKIDLHTLLRRLNAGTTGSPYAMVAMPPGMKDAKEPPLIGKLAVCAGSGSGVFSHIEGTADADVELLVTGEMSHHDALRHTQLGRIVATVFHSNSERRYLQDVLKPVVEKYLRSTSYAETRVLVSKADRDPFDILDISPLA